VSEFRVISKEELEKVIGLPVSRGMTSRSCHHEGITSTKSSGGKFVTVEALPVADPLLPAASPPVEWNPQKMIQNKQTYPKAFMIPFIFSVISY
jgi:hypothetical protein